ncbi:TPA: hypothetical protein RTH42_000752 [Campylobacter jejuni]|nr:thiol:disulfide interchange protein DsbA [Campylobacter jejuni subsp. jejuni 414]HDZ4932476.1 hypothetical protein [Campylobacter jejuni]HDZ4944586.1 hypothetical protein [Campylobacter jejuni]HDZ4954536.1 hypothetical protein [Campylobacter jejuni]HDZ4966302.1 hypothetical protein [Campylobacter jejuni]
MKFLIKFARSIVVFAFSASALNEGKKYVILKTLDNLLIEIFSYYCTHCYNYHKFNIMGKVKKKLPNLTYKFLCYKFMGDYGKLLKNSKILIKIVEEFSKQK